MGEDEVGIGVLIQRDQMIVGRPAIEVRAMMRMLYDVAHSERGLAEQFGLDDATARQLVDGLRAEGLIEVSERAGHYAVGVEEDEAARRPVLWSTTIAGTALAKARIGVPMQRVKAQALVDGVLDRVVEVNGSSDWLHWVIEVLLYGSFARDGDGPVGDVDVAVHLEARYPHEDYMRLQEEMIDRDGARPSGLVAAIGYAQQAMTRYLRGSSPKVDLVEHDAARPLPSGAISRVVYSFDPGTEPLP